MEWTVTEQGQNAVIEVRKEDKEDGLYKAYIPGMCGSCLLGTMLPERGQLFLRRTLSIESLKRQGAWPVRRVECRMSHSFQNVSPAIPWADEVLRNSARGLLRYTVRREGGNFVLVTSFDPRAPFPLTPLFCLSRVEGGRLIFSFHSDGTPYIFQPDGKDRKDTNAQRRETHGKSDHQGTGRVGGSAGL